MNRNSPSDAPVIELPVMPMYSCEAHTGEAPAGIADVLTIGEEATVFQPVRRALRPTGWAIVHVRSVEAALAFLRSNVAVVAVAGTEVAGDGWRAMLSALRSVADAPEVVLVTSNDVALPDALEAGAFDLLRRPLDHADLLWAVATAWHSWMTRREQGFGGGPCSDA